MKRAISFLTLYFILQLQAFAGWGPISEYHIKFTLKNGTGFEGFVELGYVYPELGKEELASYSTDKGVWKLLALLAKDSSKGEYLPYSSKDVIVYKKIYYPKFFTSPFENAGYGVVLKEDRIFLSLNEISSVKFLFAKTSDRDWTTSNILITDKKMLSLFNTQKYINWSYIEIDELDGFFLFNYDTSVDSTKLLLITGVLKKELLLPIDQNKSKKDQMAIVMKKLEEVNDELSARKMILFRSWNWD